MIELILAVIFIFVGGVLVYEIIGRVLGPQIRHHRQARSQHHPVYRKPRVERPCLELDCRRYAYMRWESDSGNASFLYCFKHAHERQERDGGTVIRAYETET